LRGAALTTATTDGLPSEGVALGAVQVPADGQPLVFLADHPTTGGYPVIGVVDAADLPALAQARPGEKVRFHGSQ
jgi:allophanate hydrolase subunit 2